MAINSKIPKRHNIDKLKFQMKIDKRFHTKFNSINLKINNIIHNNISSILLYFFLVLFFPSLSKEINVFLLSNEIIIKINGTGNQAILDSRVQEPSQIYLNNESQSDMYNVYNLEKEPNEIRIVWNSPIKSCNFMFYDFSNIIEADLSKFDASQVTEMSNMFKGCTSLTSINFNISNTSSVTDLSYMFYGCTSLKELDLSYFDSSSITNIEQTFFECKSLLSLNLGNFNSSSVSNFYQTFFGLHSIKSLDLSHFDTSSATSMFQMFLNCYELEYLDISNFDTSNVNNMHEMFLSCRALTSLNLSNFDTSKVTIMNRIFYDCSSLEYLDLSTKFNTSKIVNMDEMFSLCYSLKSLDLSSFDTSSVTYMGKMFRECQSLKYLDISNFNTSKVESMNEMFFNCSSLTSLELGNLDLSFVTDMNKIFYNCHSLLSLNLYNFNPKQISNEMFFNVSKSLLYCIDDNNALGSQINNFIRVNCSELCSSISNSKYIIEKNKCTSDCSKDDIYIFEYNYICYSACPNDSYQYDNFTCKNNNEYNSDTTNYFYENTKTTIKISDSINSELVNEVTNNLGINSDINEFHEINRSIYSYEINTNLFKLHILYKNHTFIDLSQEVKNFIYNKFELNKEKDKIYILIDEFISEDPRLATKNYNYRIFLENGTELNLSLIDEDIYIDIYTKIKDKDLANFNYSKYFYMQGYDIYDKNSEFYNDVCAPAFINENDITLEDRKKYIYPNNISLCKNNCKYKKFDLEEERIICLCNINSLKSTSDEENNFLNEDDGNFISYLLDKINYKIFKCYKVIKSLDNLKINLAFYIILLVFLALIIINLISLFYSLPKLIKMMYIDAPTPNKVKKEIIMELKRLRNLEKNNPLNPRKKKKSNSLIILKKIKNQKPIKKSMKNNDVTNSIKDILINPFSEESILKSRKQSFDDKNIKKEDLNDLPYTLALTFDKRSIFQIFYSLIIQKLEIINLFISDEKVKLMIICEYILSLLINFFFNALLYSDEVISNKYHNNGELDFIVTLFLSISSNIITSIICYYVNYSKGIDERYELIMKIKKEYYYLKNIIIFFKYLKIKFIFFFMSEILIICSSFYYTVIFFIIYSKSIGSLIVNYFSSLFESFLTSIIICIIIVSTRKIGLAFSSKKLYNTSKYINNYY